MKDLINIILFAFMAVFLLSMCVLGILYLFDKILLV